jgi:hypothetical protein
MLLDMSYSSAGRGEPRFFDAKLDAGVLRVDPAVWSRGDAEL